MGSESWIIYNSGRDEFTSTIRTRWEGRRATRKIWCQSPHLKYSWNKSPKKKFCYQIKVSFQKPMLKSLGLPWFRETFHHHHERSKMNHNFKFPPVLELPFSKPAKVQFTLGESRELAPQMEKYTWSLCWSFGKKRCQLQKSSILVRLLMEEILHHLIASLSHYLQGFIHPWWCRSSSINSIGEIKPITMVKCMLVLSDSDLTEKKCIVWGWCHTKKGPRSLFVFFSDIFF